MRISNLLLLSANPGANNHHDLTVSLSLVPITVESWGRQPCAALTLECVWSIRASLWAGSWVQLCMKSKALQAQYGHMLL